MFLNEVYLVRCEEFIYYIFIHFSCMLTMSNKVKYFV